MSVVTRGGLELGLRFDQFPSQLHELLEQRIRTLTEELETRIQAVTPYLTGRLRREISSRIFADAADRVAGYVSVQGEAPSDYPKAGTLEYGTDKPRRARESALAARLHGGKRRLTGRLSRPVHIAARRYLRDPFEAMRPEIESAFADVMGEATDGGS